MRRPWRRAAAAVVVCAALVPACSSSDSEAGQVSGTIPHIGPRAIDVDRAMMVIVDSLDDIHDDIRIRMRVVNLGDSPFDVGAEDTFYAPLVVIRDDLDNTYPAVAVEPAGVNGWSVGHFDLRVDGPFDPDAEEFTLEVTTNRGPIATEPAPAPVGDTAQWSTGGSVFDFADLSVVGPTGRAVSVTKVADRGTHVEVSVEVADASGLTLPDDLRATLMSADGSTLESLPPASTDGGRLDALTSVLRFPGMLPLDSGSLTLTVAGIEVEIPVPQRSPATASNSAWYAELPRLPDLIHARITTEPLPASTLSPAN